MDSVYILQTYEYDSYSYSGISDSAFFIHKTREGAEKHAETLKLKVVRNCDDPNKECCIEKEDFLE